MPETRGTADVVERLRRLATRTDGGVRRSVELVELGLRSLAYEFVPPAKAETGIVICPSFFELKTLQASEMRFAEAASRDGHHAIYLQPPGTGESFGDPEDVRFEERVSSAVAVAERALTNERCRDVVFFGCRLGGAVAIRAAQSMGRRSFATWDPVVKGADYLKQARRLDRIAAMAGRRRKYESPEDQLTERGWATLLGNVVTQQIYDDLQALEVGRPMDPTGPGFVVCLNDASLEAARSALEPLTQDLTTTSLGRRHLGHLGFAPDDALSSIPPTLGWLKEARAQ